MKRQEKLALRAVYEKDIEKLLESLGILDDVKNGQQNCYFCNEKVFLENFGGIIRTGGNLEIFCEKIECYMKMLKERKSR